MKLNNLVTALLVLATGTSASNGIFAERKLKKDSDSDVRVPGSIVGVNPAECEICSPENKVRPLRITFEYIGGQGGISAYQSEDKASCRNQMFPESTTVTAYGIPYQVKTGDLFTMSNGGDKLDAETDFFFPDGSSCSIHTSCSQPLVDGDILGPFKIIAEPAQCVNVPPIVGSPFDCEICSPENKIRPPSLTVQYIPGQGAISAFQDEDKATCRNQMFPESTTITAYGIQYQVQRDTVFTFVGDDGRLDAETDFFFPDGSSCYIHTSCSQPLVAGDQIGPFLILEGNNCVFVKETFPPTSSPTAPPTPCECIANANHDPVTGAVTVDFDMCGQTAQPFDFVGIYPCDAETGITDASWDAAVSRYNGGVGGFEIGYPQDEALLFDTFTWWAYLCGNTGSKCQQDGAAVWPTSGQVVIDPTAIRVESWFFQGQPTLPPGCYKVLMNRYATISAPPYIPVCPEWREGYDGSEFTIP